MLSSYTLKTIGFNIFHLILSLITTGSILMTCLGFFYLAKHIETFQNFLNGQHVNMLFTIESEKQNRKSFLDVQTILEDKTFVTSFYRKPTFSGVYTHFDIFLQSTYKFGTVYTLSYRCSQIGLRWTKLHNELVFVEEILLRDHYPEDFVNK